MDLDYTETRRLCPKCRQLNPRDTDGLCGFCGYYDPATETGALMEEGRQRDSWEADRLPRRSGRKAGSDA